MIPDLKKKQHLYYVHKCPHSDMRQVTISESELFTIIDNEIGRVSFSLEFADLLKSLFGGAIIRHQKDRNNDIAVLRRRINSLEVKKNKLYDLCIDDDYFTRDDLKRKLIELDRSIHSLKSHFKSLQVDQERLQVEVNNVIETFRSLLEMYAIADQEKKARILKEMADCVIVKKNRAGIEWKSPISFL